MSRDTESRLTVNTKDVSGAFVFSTALYSSQPVSAKAKNRANTFEGVAPRDDARVSVICCYSIGLQQLVRQHEPPAPQVSGTKLQFSATAIHHLFIEMRLASPFLFLAPKMLLWARRVDSKQYQVDTYLSRTTCTYVHSSIRRMCGRSGVETALLLVLQ